MSNNQNWHGRLVGRQNGVAISGRNLRGGPSAPQRVVAPPPVAASSAAHVLRAHPSHEYDVQASPLETAPEPQRGLQSGAFTKEGSRSFDALRPSAPAAALPNLRSPRLPQPMAASSYEQLYGKLPEMPERAELHVDDLRLDVANPYLASSLQPPPPRSRWHYLGWVGGAIVLVGAGYAIALTYGAPALQSHAPGARPVVSIVPPSDAPQLPMEDPPVVAPVHVPAPALALVNTAASSEFSPTSAETRVAQVPVMRATKAMAGKPRMSARALKRARAKASAKAAPVASRREDNATEAKAVVAPTTTASPALAAPQLPAHPTREQVKTSVERVRGQLQSCAAGAHGKVLARLTVAGSGRVTNVLVEGEFAGTPAGSCMARVLRAAEFPSFASPSLNVGYPFAF